MSVYLDLLPAPQFDRSLVTYTVANFQRIKDAFVRTSSRVYCFATSSAGAWPKSFTVNHPFKADVLWTYAASCWSNAGGMTGTGVQIDGGFTGMWGYYYFNEAGSHKLTAGTGINRGLAAGNHTWTIGIPAGNTSSDGNDQGYIALTMVEVN